jgi:hypothetical protein
MQKYEDEHDFMQGGKKRREVYMLVRSSHYHGPKPDRA